MLTLSPFLQAWTTTSVPVSRFLPDAGGPSHGEDSTAESGAPRQNETLTAVTAKVLQRTEVKRPVHSDIH